MGGPSSKQLKLQREINHELAQLQKLADVAVRLAALPVADRHPWDAAAAAKFISDLVLGLENLIKRTWLYLERPVPDGADSHQQLLAVFLADPQLGGQLPAEWPMRFKMYLRFRHRFLHGYGYEVNWEIVEEPLRWLPEAVSLLKQCWGRWLATHLKATP
jgi:hypothetical protein